MIFYLLCNIGFTYWICWRYDWLVLDLVGFPIIVAGEASLIIAAGTDFDISILGSIYTTINRYRPRNIDFQVSDIMAITVSIGVFIGSFLTSFNPMVFSLYILGI